MSRPKNKVEHQTLSNKNYITLHDFINEFTLDQLHGEFPSQFLNRNIRDVLAHLHHYHTMFLQWYQVGMSGEKPEMPAKEYTWKTTKELNIAINKLYKKASLPSVLKMLDSSFKEVQCIINSHSDEELFEKSRYAWTGTTSLGAYLISATSSHYDWAYKLINKYKKSLKKTSP